MSHSERFRNPLFSDQFKQKKKILTAQLKSFMASIGRFFGKLHKTLL